MQTSWRHIPRPLLMHTSASPLIFVLLLRISWCLCFMPTSAQIINDVSAAAEDGSATSSSSGEIFELDHAIGGKDAAIAFKASADELINKVAPAWCSACTETIVQYCLDQRVLKDHCCCDSGHTRDMLPWLPHSCYVGEKCKPYIGSCIKYTEIRECCCDRIMAKQWKATSGVSTRNGLKSLLLSGSLLLLLRIWSHQ